jgi:hypothetical protein
MRIKPGKILETYAICCRRCKSYDTLFNARSRSEAGIKAREQGWVFIRAFGWLCSECDEVDLKALLGD